MGGGGLHSMAVFGQHAALTMHMNCCYLRCTKLMQSAGRVPNPSSMDTLFSG